MTTSVDLAPRDGARVEPLTIVLLGNPNTGKSTLFAALVGTRQRTGNYPGVTVEKRLGRMELDGRSCEVIDLPGTYSLAPQSPDEMLAVDVLLGRCQDVPRPDLVLCIVDASNLSRNLYLVSQVLEIGLPTVVALNMTDIARRRGLDCDVPRLQQQLGIPVVATQANRRMGLSDLRSTLGGAIAQPPAALVSLLPESVQQEISQLEQLLRERTGQALPRYLVERLLFDTGYLESTNINGADPEIWQAVRAARKRVTDSGTSLAAVETTARYQWISQVIDGVLPRQDRRTVDWSDRLDQVLTHRLWGSIIFGLLMLLMFQAVFRWSSWFMNGLEFGVERLGMLVTHAIPHGALQSLLVDGVLGGVGGVLVFLPQIFILFLFIAVLEDCGYMARAAYLMDRLMSRIGLSGKSFIPLLSSFACAIPGIMATRVIEDRRDRLITILIAPLMSCSARLPVYTLLISAFIPPTAYLGGFLGLQGIVLLSLYLLGIVVAVAVALLLRRTVLPGEAPPFVMELPTYKLPDARVVLHRMLTSGWEFVYSAGTLIFAVTLVVWAAGYYPRATEFETSLRSRQQILQSQLDRFHGGDPTVTSQQAADWQAEATQIENRIAGAQMRQSYLGRLGMWIEPIVRPLGWDWKIGCAVIASLPAREVVVGTLSVIYNLGAGNEGSRALQESLQNARWDGSDRRVFNVPVALSIMVFFALCAQCISTLAVIWRETNSWRWPVFAFTYMTVLAYIGAWVTYRVGMLFVATV